MATKTLYLKQFSKTATRDDPTKVQYEVVKARNVLLPQVGSFLSPTDVQVLMDEQKVEIEITRSNR